MNSGGGNLGASPDSGEGHGPHTPPPMKRHCPPVKPYSVLIVNGGFCCARSCALQ